MHWVQMLPRIRWFLVFFLFPTVVLSLLVNPGCLFLLQQRCNMLFCVGAPELSKPLGAAVSAEAVGGRT